MLDPGFNPWVGKISWRKKWQPTPVFLPGKSHGRWNLVGYSPWGRKESDTTERLHFHFQATGYKTQTKWRRQAKGQRDCLSQSPTHPGFFFPPPHCKACGILVPWPGIYPAAFAEEAWSLNHWAIREVPPRFLMEGGGDEVRLCFLLDWRSTFIHILEWLRFPASNSESSPNQKVILEHWFVNWCWEMLCQWGWFLQWLGCNLGEPCLFVHQAVFLGS